MEILLYLLAGVGYLGPLLVRLRPGLARVMGHPAWLGLGMACHVAGLVVEGAAAGHLPLDSMRWGLAALGLAVGGAAVAARQRPRMLVLSDILLSLALAFVAVAPLGPGETVGRGPDNLWFPVHVGLLLLGFVLLAVCFALSALFLWVRRRLKTRRLKGIARLPPLETLDRLSFRAMVAGFVALTAGMTVGGVWAATHPGASMGHDLTVYATLAVWLWYAAGLHLRLYVGWRGRLAAIFGVVGFGGIAAVTALSLVIYRGWHGAGG